VPLLEQACLANIFYIMVQDSKKFQWFAFLCGKEGSFRVLGNMTILVVLSSRCYLIEFRELDRGVLVRL
jgi:hypothetical protein